MGRTAAEQDGSFCTNVSRGGDVAALGPGSREVDDHRRAVSAHLSKVADWWIFVRSFLERFSNPSWDSNWVSALRSVAVDTSARGKAGERREASVIEQPQGDSFSSM